MIQNIKSTIGNLQRRVEENEPLYGWLLLAVPLLIFFIVSLVPILFAIWMSFHQGTSILDTQFVGFDNYSALLDDSTFWLSVETGVTYAVYAVTIQTLFGVGIALTINESFKFNNIVRTIVLLPYLVPSVAVALVAVWMLNNQYGVINYFLQEAGVTSQPIQFFGAEMAMHSVVWISSWKFTIFITLIILARLQSIDQELYEMAKTNGANALNRFLDVTLPHIKSTLYLVILLRTIWMFNKFDMIWLLTNGGPFQETTTMVVYAYLKVRSLLFGRGAAISVIMFMMLLGTGIIYFKKFKPEEEVEVQ